MYQSSMIVIIIIFIVGYLLIAFGNIISLNKVIPSILISSICWSLIIFFRLPVYEFNKNILVEKDYKNLLLLHLGKTSEIVFFIIGTMCLISILEKFNSFEILKKFFYTNTKQIFLWKLSIISFLLSAIIDNLTTTIVLISLLRKLIRGNKERLYFLGIVIISSNAGGVWSPIGDITTTMLWISKKVNSFHLLKKLFIPSVLCMFTSTYFASLMPIFNGKLNINKDYSLYKKNYFEEFLMLQIGLILMLMVPIFKTIVGIPPYMGIMFSLGILLCIVTIKYKNDTILFIDETIKSIDVSSVLFFFGILLSVASIESIGVLYYFSFWMKKILTRWEIISFLFGFISSIIDNVPLVAATISMFSYSLNHNFWHFIAYSSGVGGSLLLIGSASGITAMGMEKMDFLWYLKKISWLSLIGYITGFIYLILVN